MESLTTFERWYGRDEPPPAIVKLRAGDVELEFQEGDIRYIRRRGQELIRRIYVAVRDINWNTIPAKITDLAVDSGREEFTIQFDAHHHEGPLAFRWRATIRGKPDNTIEYTMDGTAGSDFRYCRIGFSVLHPIEGIAGRPYRASTPDGPISGTLPAPVAPQSIENGLETPIFPSCSSLTVDMPGDTRITTEFEGDLFEMEDQRNWTDGSFKTYCTPLSLGYPHRASTGQRFYQKVIIKPDFAQPAQELSEREHGQVVAMVLEDDPGQADRRLPKIGFGIANSGIDAGAEQLGLLSRLRPDHLKIEVHLQEPSWPQELERAMAIATQIGSALEVALFLTDQSEDALATLKSLLSQSAIARVIVFHEEEAPVGVTSPRWMQLVRNVLSGALPGARFMGGANGNFAELNRQRPDISVMDGVSYTINPQVHAWDERSLVEAIQAQHDTVVTARTFSDTLPICVSSVTLKPPFNQAATEEEAPPDPNELPASVDARQMSLFAAAWTAGSIGSLASAGVDSITYYETIGWRGLMETMQGSPLPGTFRSFPGMVFPVYYIFEFLAGAKEDRLLLLRSDDALRLAGFGLKKENATRLLVSNHQPRAQEAQLRSLPAGEASLRRLNADTAATAATDPAAFLERWQRYPMHDGRVDLALAPYETAFIEIRHT